MRPQQRNIKVLSHIWIDRPLVALSLHPIDILIGILDVAGLAVNAVLGDDDKSSAVRLHPFVNVGRRVADDFCSAMSLTCRCTGWSSSWLVFVRNAGERRSKVRTSSGFG